MNDEYDREMHRFYEIFRLLQKKYNLMMRSHFSVNGENTIEIWEHRAKRRYICKISDAREIWCYKKAADELEYYEKRKKEEIHVSTDRNLTVLRAVGDGRA